MRKSFTFYIVLCFSISLYAQDEFYKLPQAKTQKPSLVFNKNIIGNENLLNSLGASEQEIKEKVEEVYILLEKRNRETNKYYNLSELGILLVDLNEIPESKTQSQLNGFFGFDEQNKIYVNGYLLENKEFEIATTSIMEIEIVEPDTVNALKNKVLNIWTLAKSERYSEYNN